MQSVSIACLLLVVFIASTNAQIVISIQNVFDCVTNNPLKTASADCIVQQIVLSNKDKDNGIQGSIDFLLGNKMTRNVLNAQLLEFRDALKKQGITSAALEKAVQEAYPALSKAQIVINIQDVFNCVAYNPLKTASAECIVQIVLSNKDKDNGIQGSIDFLLGNKMTRPLLNNQLQEFRAALKQQGITNDTLEKAVQVV